MTTEIDSNHIQRSVIVFPINALYAGFVAIANKTHKPFNGDDLSTKVKHLKSNSPLKVLTSDHFPKCAFAQCMNDLI